jgi:hypothetical protein
MTSSSIQKTQKNSSKKTKTNSANLQDIKSTYKNWGVGGKGVKESNGRG